MIMYLEWEEAWAEGFNSYKVTDVCPYSYPDLKRAWWSGRFNATVSYASGLYGKASAEYKDERRGKQS